MQGVRATVRPCPCEARRSRIHMRVYGARHGRARRDLGRGSAETTANRSARKSSRRRSHNVCCSSRGTDSKSARSFRTGAVRRREPCQGITADGSSHLGSSMLSSLRVREQRDLTCPPPCTTQTLRRRFKKSKTK